MACNGDVIELVGEGLLTSAADILLHPPEPGFPHMIGKPDFSWAVVLGSVNPDASGNFRLTFTLQPDMGTTGRGDRLVLAPGTDYLLSIRFPSAYGTAVVRGASLRYCK